MGNLNAQAQGDLALGGVTNTGVPAFGGQRGFATAITDNGVGDSTLTMDNAQALATAGVVLLTMQGNVIAFGSVEVASATTLRVRTWTLTIAVPPVIAAADVSYWIRITPISPV